MTEYLWMNLPESLEPHEYEHLGDDSVDRQHQAQEEALAGEAAGDARPVAIRGHGRRRRDFRAEGWYSA